MSRMVSLQRGKPWRPLSPKELVADTFPYGARRKTAKMGKIGLMAYGLEAGP